MCSHIYTVGKAGVQNSASIGTAKVQIIEPLRLTSAAECSFIYLILMAPFIFAQEGISVWFSHHGWGVRYKQRRVGSRRKRVLLDSWRRNSKMVSGHAPGWMSCEKATLAAVE